MKIFGGILLTLGILLLIGSVGAFFEGPYGGPEPDALLLILICFGAGCILSNIGILICFPAYAEKRRKQQQVDWWYP